MLVAFYTANTANEQALLRVSLGSRRLRCPDVIVLDQNHPLHAMLDYKKRVRLLAERFGASIDYSHDDGLTVTTTFGSIRFIPSSKNDMTCKVTTSKSEIEFACAKAYVFDIVHRFARGRPLDGYKPKGPPLTLQEYINEELAIERVSDLKKRVLAGIAINEELGGNHYNAEFFDGILILSDVFTGAPANVVEIH